MQDIAIIQVSEAGSTIAAALTQGLTQSAEAGSCRTQRLERTQVGECWHAFDAFVFIGAMGICVRTIAPFIEDKHTDPAVVCVDTAGQHVVSVLSGHIGGANMLTQHIADMLKTDAVITTQSDNLGIWAIDTFEQRFGWHPSTDCEMNEIIATFVNRQPTALLLRVHDEGTDYLQRTLPGHVRLVSDISEAADCRLLIIVSPFNEDLPRQPMQVIQFVPRMLSVGFGLAHHPDDYKDIPGEIYDVLGRQGVNILAVKDFCTIDVKADEPFVDWIRQKGEQVRFFTAEELATIDVPTPSATVEKHVGTPSVSEAAAILGSGHGQLVVRKIKGKNWTVAVAIPSTALPRQAHIEIVGAGPGDPDLISVRGRRMLEQADLILYAGSLVPKELTDCHKAGAVVRSSADMTLDEQCRLMKEHYRQGHLIVRLHTGDPCIFGAIQEQMAFFDREGMHYHITPGISSFLAAAAELRSQFTIPERTQTIILTRGEGRTPMPEREKLHLLARSQSTMCIFLSAAIVDDVQQQLLREYPEDTPVAACYHLTWPDQRIYRGQLKDLARIVHDNHLTLTTMIVVGEAIDNRQGLSELYSPHFTHLFRKGEQ